MARYQTEIMIWERR